MMSKTVLALSIMKHTLKQIIKHINIACLQDWRGNDFRTIPLGECSILFLFEAVHRVLCCLNTALLECVANDLAANVARLL